jgi:hypothetical protein
VLARILKRESSDVWLRIGVRACALLAIGAVGLLTEAAIENGITGDVSLATRMAWFAFLVCSVPTTAFAVVCVATGLARRYLLRTRRGERRRVD